MIDTKPVKAVVGTPGERPVLLPEWAINMTRRTMQMLATQEVVELKLLKINGVRYLINEQNELERLG